MVLSILTVDQSKCTKCGLCAEVCPPRIIELGANWPEMTLAERCIACGHCVAICPQAALDNEKNPLANQLPLEKFPVIDSDTAYKFLRSRRSVRMYKKEPVDHDTMLKLLDIARFAETAGNSQGLSYQVIDDPEMLQEIIKVTIDFLDREYKAGHSWAQRYGRYVDMYRKEKRDTVLRGAPTLVLALANEELMTAWDSARLSFAYVELFATTLGLGTVWGGYVELCASSKYQPFLDLLNLPAGKKVCGALMVGYPKIKYQRLVDRNPLQVTWGRGDQQ